ncbi:MAG: anthranilate phosphoribosyltransferase [Candidatus Sumerlaeia bacterium]
MIQDALEKLLSDEWDEFGEQDAREVAAQIMNGDATDVQIGAFLVALRLRGERLEHIKGFVQVMREKMQKIGPLRDEVVVDTCGTGGDVMGTFNISTAAALIAAAAGVKVAKHGNRSVSSKCGSADVLEALGVKIDMPPARTEQCLREVGICFLFAPVYHPAMKHAVKARRELGVRTIFNLIGPLSNPANASHQVIGTPDPRWLEVFAQVLQEMGSRRALIVSAEDGLDEITTTTITQAVELTADGQIRTLTIDPADFDVPYTELDALVGGDATRNAEILTDILSGREGPPLDIACLNAGAALYVAGSPSLEQGYLVAREAVKSGAAMDKLDALRAFTARAQDL